MGNSTGIPTKRDKPSTDTFGGRLRREREMRGITLDEISESTKISRRHLEALETERFDQLPGAVFNKGFVRAYARFLGIDEDQAVADYSAASNEQPQPEDKFPLEIHDEPNPDLNPRRSYLPLAFALAALVGVLVGYGFWVKSKQHTSEPTEATKQPPSAAATNNGKTASTEPAPTPSSGEAGQTSAATPAPAPPAPAQHLVATSTAADPPPTATEAKGAKPVEKEKSFFVSIKAKEDSWVSVVADGKSVMERVLPADKHKKIKAGKLLTLRTGNAGGLEVSFNGHSLGALGNENEPRTLTFNGAGLVQ
jgi:cytoskeleton protein RodZ